MRIHNIQYRKDQELLVSQVLSSDLEDAKTQVIAQEGLSASQVLKDEAIL